MVVKVYGMKTGVCPQRVMHCLMEKGVDFELVHVDVETMEHKQPAFMEKQPFGQVPYVVDGDFELYESRAIVRYFCEKYAGSGPNLLGRTPEERAKVDQWLDVEAINFNPLAFTLVFNNFLAPMRGMARNEAEAAAATAKLEKVLDVYERQLSRTKYLVGDEFTLADLTHIPATRYLMEHCGMAYLVDGRKHLKAWWGDITSRPGWKKCLEFLESDALHYSP